ncbi:MAG: TVP38/TMEM64 family protein [Rhizobiales bacterium]|nr:TVP38/TMEM64 family protein [Hyphomicrobiales bacterium]
MAEQRDAGPAPEKGKNLIRKFLPLIILAAFMALILSQGWHKYLSFEQLALHRDLLKEAVVEHWFLALCCFMALYVAIVALSLPGGALLTLAGGFLFGWVAGGISVVIAATIGAGIVFTIARSSLGEALAARAGPWIEKLSTGFREDAFNYLLFLRLVPAFPFWLVNLAPALLGMNLRTFLVATFVGIIPGTFAFSFLGTGLDSIFEAQQQANQNCVAEDCAFEFSLSALVTPEILIALAALGIVALIPVALKRWRNRQGN